jgi:hypothetical protein
MKKLVYFIFAIILLLSAYVVTSSAQTVYYRRPVIIRHYDPFWRGTLWDPYWGWDRGYGRDPFYYEMRQQYYDRKAVSDARRKLAKDREKFYADGYLDAKEAERLAKDQRDYDKAVDRLNRHS